MLAGTRACIFVVIHLCPPPHPIRLPNERDAGGGAKVNQGCVCVCGGTVVVLMNISSGGTGGALQFKGAGKCPMSFLIAELASFFEVFLLLHGNWLLA